MRHIVICVVFSERARRGSCVAWRRPRWVGSETLDVISSQIVLRYLSPTRPSTAAYRSWRVTLSAPREVLHARSGRKARTWSRVRGTASFDVAAPAADRVHLWKVVDFATLTTTPTCAHMVDVCQVRSPAHSIHHPVLTHHSSPCADVVMPDLLRSCPDRRARAVRASHTQPAS